MYFLFDIICLVICALILYMREQQFIKSQNLLQCVCGWRFHPFSILPPAIS